MKELRAKLERIGAEGGKDLDESKGTFTYYSLLLCGIPCPTMVDR